MDLEFCLFVGDGDKICGLHKVLVVCVLFDEVVDILLCLFIVWVGFRVVVIVYVVIGNSLVTD